MLVLCSCQAHINWLGTMLVLAAQLEGAFWKEGPKALFPALKSTGSKIMKMSYDATGSL